MSGLGVLERVTPDRRHSTLPAAHDPYDLAFARRVGALDGRHLYDQAIVRTDGRFFLDTGNPLRKVELH